MARPLRIQYPGAYYHVTCRGNERKDIFLDAKDENIFLELLYRFCQISQPEIGRLVEREKGSNLRLTRVIS